MIYIINVIATLAAMNSRQEWRKGRNCPGKYKLLKNYLRFKEDSIQVCFLTTVLSSPVNPKTITNIDIRLPSFIAHFMAPFQRLAGLASFCMHRKGFGTKCLVQKGNSTSTEAAHPVSLHNFLVIFLKSSQRTHTNCTQNSWYGKDI